MANIVFIEFANEVPFAVVTDDDLRYDVDFYGGTLHYHCCAAGGCFDLAYLEGSDHKYWAADGIQVVLGDGVPAPPENRLADIDPKYKAPLDEWPDATEEGY